MNKYASNISEFFKIESQLSAPARLPNYFRYELITIRLRL